MKPSMIQWVRYFALGAALACFAGLPTTRVSASVTYDYDLFTINPDTLPQNPPWTLYGGSPSAGSVTGDTNVLTLTDSATFGYGPIYSAPPTGISPTTTYEMRSRVRIVSNTLSTANFLYYQDMYDGSRYLAIGVSLDNVTGETKFSLLDTSGHPLVDPVTLDPLTVEVPGSDFFQVDVAKTGITGGSSDTVTLSIDGTTVLTTSYTTLASFLFTGLDWGEGSTPATGIAEVTGVSFGIGAAAPVLLPEPSSLGLVMLGTLLIHARRQRGRA